MNTTPYGPAGGWVLIVMLASIGFAMTPVFARWMGLAGFAPEVIAFYRFALTAAVTLPFLSLRHGNARATLWGIVAGVVMGLGWIGYVMALERTSVATAGVLYMSYPLFTLVFAWIMLGLVPGWRGTLAAGLVIGAGYVALAPTGRLEVSLETLALGLAAPLSFGFAITVLTGILIRLNPLQRMASAALGSCLGLAPLVARHPVEQIVPQGDQWMLVLGLAIGTALVPQFFYVVAAPRIGAMRTAIAGSFELPAMMALGMLAFGEKITEREMMAGGLIILAILISALSRQPKGRAPAA